MQKPDNHVLPVDYLTHLLRLYRGILCIIKAKANAKSVAVER